MSETAGAYSLKILDLEVASTKAGEQELIVTYQGRHKPHQAKATLPATDLQEVLRACEAVAQQIFHAEFRLNDQIELYFALADGNDLKIWHTQPNMYIKCPLTMSMKWSCTHLSKMYKTMTTLGVVELPSELSLAGNAVGLNETAKVIMDSMANGVEFVGNLVLMRPMVDHGSMVHASAVGTSGHPAGH